MQSKYEKQMKALKKLVKKYNELETNRVKLSDDGRIILMSTSQLNCRIDIESLCRKLNLSFDSVVKDGLE